MRIAVKMPLILICLTGSAAAQSNADFPVSVNVHNFRPRRNRPLFRRDGQRRRLRQAQPPPSAPSSIDAQDVVRMNRDTLYSSGVFDLPDAAPVIITLPDAGKRFMSMQVLSQDQYTTTVVYAPGSHTFDRNGVGTRYVAILIRTLGHSEDAKDIEDANRLQDAVQIEQARSGAFEVPRWDTASQNKARDALSVLGALGGTVNKFGNKGEVDPLDFVIGAAIGSGEVILAAQRTTRASIRHKTTERQHIG